MLRVIVREQNGTKAANIGGSTETTVRTFDLIAPALEEYLSEPRREKWSYCHREVVGVEVIVEADKAPSEEC